MTQHLSDLTVAMNIAQHIADKCNEIERNPAYKNAVKTALKNTNHNDSFSALAMDNIIAAFERMMMYDHQPYPQALEFYDRLHYLKSGEITPSQKSKRRFRDTVRRVTPAGTVEEASNENADRTPYGPARPNGDLVPDFFNITAKACGADSKEVKDLAESWLTLNYMMRQPNVIGPDSGDSAYRRAWFSSAGAMQNRIKELNNQIVEQVNKDFAAQQKKKSPNSAQGRGPRAKGILRNKDKAAKDFSKASSPTPVISEAARRAKNNKNRPVAKPDPRAIDDKLIKVNAYGVSRSKLRTQMSRMGDSFAQEKTLMEQRAMERAKVRLESKDDNDKIPFEHLLPPTIAKMIGMEDVKNGFIRDRAIILKEKVNEKFRPETHKEMEEDKEPRSRHLILKGDPGTGKTTVADAYGEFYKDLGVLKSGHVIRVTAEELCGTHVRQTGPKTRAVIEKAIDGVLFIDEAYLLYSSSDVDYGMEALTMILDAMDTERDRLVVIMAGYSDEMDKMLAMNPGNLSRLGRVINVPSPSNEDLLKILDLKLAAYNINIDDPEMRQHIVKKFAESRKILGRNFGCGRFAKNVADKLDEYQSYRLMQEGLLNEDILNKDPDDPQIQELLSGALDHITQEDLDYAIADAQKASLKIGRQIEQREIGFRLKRKNMQAEAEQDNTPQAESSYPPQHFGM